MSKFRNQYLLILLFLLLVNCSTEVVRVNNPKTDKDKKTYGLVAFGLYVYNEKQTDLLDMFSKDKGRVFNDLGRSGVQFSEIISKDAAKNPVSVNPYPNDSPVLVEKRDSVDYFESKVGYISPFYLLLSVDPTKEYLITRIAYSYEISCGQNCRKTVVQDFPLNLAKSFKAFPIKAKAGEITFGGILMARVFPTMKDDPFGIPDDTAGLTELFSGNKVAISLEPGEEFIQKMNSDELKQFFYGGTVDKKNAEKLFYENLIKTYQEGYWKTLAEKKRAALGN
ncbi:hypothetical protein LFX25_05060 [Leptospira sp. FAT2]|uniref:plasminogen-binding receptor Lp30 n=1 Tax=Leptospira sanjuanensis TaxID=2879643 RepID=UPI001EE855AB|nr:hypothetical protein [Leptospira sanjuanensis]MCG6167146.1 hypothetical protein [Leptospira sanjuanensis]MCG6192605.1 hypothetical protein [Leptospira sanjuanensis]